MMQKFTLNEKSEIMIPNVPTFRPPLDKNGRPLNGDDTIRVAGKIITAFEKKHGRPVPIPDQRFIGWVKQFCTQLSAGKTSEEIFKKTIV